MFRASLRSIPDPFREHVCCSCLVQGPQRRPHGFRPFYNTAVSLFPGPKKPKQASSQENKERRPSPKHVQSRKIQPKRKPPIQKTESTKVTRSIKTTKSRNPPQKPAGPGVKSVPKISEKSVLSKTLEQSSPKPSASATTSRASTPNTLRDDGTISAKDLALQPLDVESQPVPRLSFGLERVLFNPGVYQLRDPRSRVYNFDPYLGSIMPVTEFDFAALKEYITSSKDDILRNIAKKEKKKYVGSTSSMTSVLSHFHYLLSNWRPVTTDAMSRGFPDQLRTFTRLLRAPAAMFLKYQNGVYAIDADKEFDSANILMNLGKSMEKLLTLPKEEFERYRRSSENKISPEEEQAVPESYHYSTLGDFVMRSQLDAYDPRLPGTGMFDLKTRAVVSIRMDTQNFEHGLGYQIRRRYGAFESYEREYYDMIRAAFLKYSLQVRIGRMDGIFVAFHNIQRIFGFQYVSLPEMDSTLHGQSDTTLGDHELRLSISLWNKALDKVTARFPKQSVRLHFETRDVTAGAFMYIFAEPVTDDEIHAIQTKNKEQIDAYQRRILDLGPRDHEDSTSHLNDSQETSPSVKAKQPDAVKDEGKAKVANDSSESSDESSANQNTDSAGSSDNGKEIMAFKLSLKNKVNGKDVDRPTFYSDEDDWDIEYSFVDLEPASIPNTYESIQKRRAKALAGRGEDEMEVAANVYIRKLRQISQEGQAFREEEDRKDRKEGLVVLDDAGKEKSKE